MPLTPEERKKIYEEEKARIEAREKLEKEKGLSSTESSLNLSQNVVGLLCYLFGWLTGIVFFVLEQKNRWVRFHAAQSMVVFLPLSIISAIFGWIPFAGWVICTVIWIFGFILWVLLMYKAYQGERYKLPIAGNIAEQIIGEVTPTSGSTASSSSPPTAASAAAPPPPPPPPPPAAKSSKKGKSRK
jgi:uncharacterized membrane protein